MLSAKEINVCDIEPVQAVSNRTKKTTITPFAEVLTESSAKNNDASAVKTSEKVSANAEKKAEQTAEKNSAQSNSAAKSQTSSVVFQDPESGATVIYRDVAAKAAANTTAADAMKTTKYDEYFKEAAKETGVSESLLKAIAKAESNFDANAVSSAGAIGVMQLMPATAKELGVTDPYDAKQNIMGGAKCIAQKLEEFDGNEELALAAYNAGSGAVKKNGGVPSYCKSYVSKVLSYKEAYQTAESA